MSRASQFLAVVVAAAMLLPVANHAQSSASAAQPLRRDLAVGGPVGVQEPAWSPDGKHVAVSYLDRIWTMTPEGKQAKAIAQDLKTSRPQDLNESVVEREPAWSADGTRLAYAADRGEGFDIFVVTIKN
ncbi:MAG: hypothetical protein ABI983_09225, partial [Acidobacteriota bacterium]